MFSTLFKKKPDQNAINNPFYKIVLDEKTLDKIKNYQIQLAEGTLVPGGYFSEILHKKLSSSTKNAQNQTVINWAEFIINLSELEFLQALLQTKKPCIYAESEIEGNGKDWNEQELSILGDISIIVPIWIHDDGKWQNPKVYQEPFPGALLFVPGALLRNDNTGQTPDLVEVVVDGRVDEEKLYALYERRLLPVLQAASDNAIRDNKKAFITIPGIGCGAFAGRFEGSLGEKVQGVIAKLLANHAHTLGKGIKAVWFDPFAESKASNERIGEIDFIVQPFAKVDDAKPQLCHPSEYGKEYVDCKFFSVVAWDHVSWPGNDFYRGARTTDDGVKAAATNTMQMMTGVKGEYNVGNNRYMQPKDYTSWEKVVTEYNLIIKVKDNVFVYQDNKLKALREKEDVRSYWLKPQHAQAIYKQASKVDKNNTLNNLTNKERPDKITQALKLLNIKLDDITFNGTDGYIITCTASTLAALKSITQQEFELSARQSIKSPSLNNNNQ